MPNCKPVEHDFLDNAPVVIVHAIEIHATPETIFKSFEDADHWPQWFDGMTKVEWTSPKPFGVGTTRTVSLGAMKVYEYFTRWEENKRFTFYFTKTNLPFVNALMEDYLLEPIGDGITRFTYTVAYEPKFPLSLLGPVGKFALTKNFEKATNSCAKFMAKL
ncbi:MAG: SRPBCC family protein [Pseudomonadales bacterium]|nr:SRPBCC family protein [Pseudomonadales bacterium]